MHHQRLAAAALVVGLVLSGCAPSPGGQNGQSPSPSASGSEAGTGITQPPKSLPSADPQVKAFVDALNKFDLSKAPLEIPPGVDVKKDLEVIFGGMDGIRPKVTLDKVEYETEGDKGTATLTLAYPLGLKGWSYQTKAPLVHKDGKWLVQWNPSVIHPDLTGDSRMRHQRKLPKRASINDSTGLALVEQRTLYEVGLDKGAVPQAQWATAAAKVAALMKVDAAAFQKKVAAGGPKQFVVAATVEQDLIPPTLADIPGGAAKETSALVAVDNFAVSLIGATGHPSADTVKKSNGDVLATDVVGLSGLQARYEKQLRGVPEVRVDIVGRKTANDGTAAEPVEEKNVFLQYASVGTPVEVSLDRDLQTKAQTILAKQPGIASLVVIRPSDGAILAAANSPAAGTFPQATYGKFAPGSTFKVVSSLAMLRAGFTPASKVNCSATLNVGGHVFGNYSDYPSSGIGNITLTQALANSCNTAFVAGAQKVTPDQLHAAAGSLGVGTDYDAGFTSNFGTVAPNNSAIDRAASMIGQGQITMSPMGMAAVAASVSSGKTTIPWLVKGKQAKSTAAPLTADEAAKLQGMMKAVVTDGSGRMLSGIMTGAKTGTAEFGQAGKYKTHGWMIAWNDKYAVAAFVQDGVSGSKSAGPLIVQLFS